MTLPVQQNPLLNAPRLRGLLELGIGNASLPLTLPATLGTPFRLYATEDIPIEGPLNGTYERRLVEEPEITLSFSNAGVQQSDAGVQASEEITFTLSNADGALGAYFFTGTVLSALVRYHLYDRETQEIQWHLFVGYLSAFDAELDVIHCRATRLNVAALDLGIPRARVTLANFPRATEAPAAPSGALGSVIATGTGIGKRIPFRRVAGPRVTSDDTGAEPLGLGDPDFHDYVAKGNLAIDRLWASGIPVDQDDTRPDEILYEVLPREYQVGGKYMTTVRFRESLSWDVSQLPVTADVQRVFPDVDDWVHGEWKWNATFGDSITGTLAEGQGGLTPAACVTGPSGHGLGAVVFDGVNDVLEFGGAFRLQVFTLEAWFYIMPTASDFMTLATSPGMDPATSTETSGWYLEWLSDGRLRWLVYIRDNIIEPDNLYVYTQQILTDPGTFPPNRWHHVVATCDAKAGTTRLFIDGIEHKVGTGDWGNAFSVAYGELDTPMRIGRPVKDIATTYWFSGKLGFVRRHAGLARNARYVTRSWWLMRRNPIEYLREFWTDEIGAAIDPISWDQAAIDLDNACTPSGGEYKADGFQSEENSALAMLEAFLPFRDPRFWLSPEGLVCTAIAKPAAAVVAQFGIGDRFNNTVELRSRSWPSLPESVKTLPIRYRLRRDENGTPLLGSEEYEQELLADILPVGKRDEPLLLPFVDDHTTAEAVRQWEAARRRARAEVLECTVGHEGRFLKPDPERLVRMSIDTHALQDADYEVIRVQARVTTRTLLLSPYDEEAFHWTAPTSLPAEPAVDTTLAMDLGTGPRIRPRQIGSGRYTFDIVIGDAIELPATTMGVYREISTNGLAVFFDQSDATYVTPRSGVTRSTFRFDVSRLPAGQKIQSLRLVVRARAASPLSLMLTSLWCPFSGWPLLTFTHPDITIQNEPSFRDFTAESRVHPSRLERWTANDIATSEFGVLAIGYGGDLAGMTLFADLGGDYPAAFDHTKFWLLGPSTSEPSPPGLNDPPTSYNRDLVGLTDGLDSPFVLSTGRYWAYARLYDVLGRPSGLIGTGASACSFDVP